MDKILQYEYIKKTRTIKEITRKDMVDKVNELIGGYNEIIKRLRRLEDEHCWNDKIYKEIYHNDK